MKSLIGILVLALVTLDVSHCGLLDPAFKHGFIKGALKGLIKGSSNGGGNDDGCQVKWEEVWKPHCTTSSEKVKLISEND